MAAGAGSRPRSAARVQHAEQGGDRASGVAQHRAQPDPEHRDSGQIQRAAHNRAQHSGSSEGGVQMPGREYGLPNQKCRQRGRQAGNGRDPAGALQSCSTAPRVRCGTAAKLVRTSPLAYLARDHQNAKHSDGDLRELNPTQTDRRSRRMWTGSAGGRLTRTPA